MQRQIRITPLNCHFGSELNGQVVWDQETFNQRQSSGIYCKSPDVSWFRLKSANDNPCLQPAFYGVRSGDHVTVSFDALLVSGEGTIAVDLIRIASDFSTSLLVSNELPSTALHTYFRNFTIPQLSTLASDDIGMVVSIRPTGINNEIIIKNVVVAIATENGSLSLDDMVVRYDRVGDYLDCLRTYSYTDIDPEYNGLGPAFAAGQIRFVDDDTVEFDEALSHFRGLFAVGAGSRYHVPVAVYLEYRCIGAVAGLKVRVRAYDSHNKAFASKLLEIPPADEWTRSVFYFDGADLAGARKVVADVGTKEPAVGMQLRNVRFSFPRFDDDRKRKPNRLEDLFTDLGARLRGIG